MGVFPTDGFFGIAILAILIISIWAGIIYLDKGRVNDYLTARGNTVVKITWELFGHGWLSESGKEGGGNRIYDVQYRDTYGSLHRVWCKTAMMSGVFLAEDKIIEMATIQGRQITAEDKVAMLEEEVRRLRASKASQRNIS